MIEIKKMLEKGKINNEIYDEHQDNDFFKGFKLRLWQGYKKIAKARESYHRVYIIQRVVALEPVRKVVNFFEITDSISTKIQDKCKP